MEKQTIGGFIAILRKSKGLTQQNLADILNVSNKTISKWECDASYTDITLIPLIASTTREPFGQIYQFEKEEFDKLNKIYTYMNNSKYHVDIKNIEIDAEKHEVIVTEWESNAIIYRDEINYYQAEVLQVSSRVDKEKMCFYRYNQMGYFKSIKPIYLGFWYGTLFLYILLRTIFDYKYKIKTNKTVNKKE